MCPAGCRVSGALPALRPLVGRAAFYRLDRCLVHVASPTLVELTGIAAVTILLLGALDAAAPPPAHGGNTLGGLREPELGHVGVDRHVNLRFDHIGSLVRRTRG